MCCRRRVFSLDFKKDSASRQGNGNFVFLCSDISALSGLTNLTKLRLDNNSLSDISVLAGLTNLTELNLNTTSLSDISALSGLTSLAILGLASNRISDLSALVANTGLGSGDAVYVQANPLNAVSVNTHIPALQSRGVTVWFDPPSPAVSIPDANLRAVIEATLGKTSGAIITEADMASLTVLTAFNANISDLTGLEHATNLTELNFAVNSILDISALAGLTNLTSLVLTFDSISDISALAANTGLGDGDNVEVRGNPLNVVSLNTHLPALQSRGVTVLFDNRVPPSLVKISGDNQKSATSTPLSEPLIVEVQDENGAAVEGVSVTFTVTAGGGTLSVQNTTTDANGKAQSTLTLGPSLGTNTVEVSGEGIEGTMTFNAISEEPPPIPTSVEPTDKLTIILLGDIKRTALFQNYPNPFNPETWIPYHLASDADVQSTIYDTQGAVVVQYDLGHQLAGDYTNRTKAFYWDGRNSFGESVGSGVYFYQLRASDYSATRQLVILK